ncbi:DUF998 domain-containing protein [Streptomyces sp. N35]|uniref:DUF998 domain-containing protein n=1 Tax=Streptomyces sp. N35 TaxID=2795730 RepID=UPI0018F469AF|nr:DUF998 domain-containing protein [Streptomyces sp. N35]
MIASRFRRHRHLLAPTVWITVVLAVTAALWAPSVNDPGLSPLQLTVSDFAALDRGGPIEMTMGLLGAVSLVLLLVARARRLPVRGLPSVLLTVWGVGLLVAAVVPTDPLTSDLSAPAYVHRYASIAAFVALPLAGLLLDRRTRALPGAAGTVLRLRALSLAALAGAVLMAYVAGPGGREFIGLVERVLLGCEVAMVGVLGRYVQRWTPTSELRLAA